MRKRYLEEEPAVNLTPLIDVVFVILIMFIVIAPLLESENIELAGANSNALSESVSVQESSPIQIYVRKDNTVWFNKQLVDQEQLSKALLESKAQYPQARPQLFHDKGALFGTYQWIKNAAEAAGFQQMDVILKPA